MQMAINFLNIDNNHVIMGFRNIWTLYNPILLELRMVTCKTVRLFKYKVKNLNFKKYLIQQLYLWSVKLN